MDCYYINLDRELQRRRRLEQNFAASKLEHWTLTRVPAVDAAYVEERDLKLAGQLSNAEKACTLSHHKAISQSCAGVRPAMFLEDDVHFGRYSCRIIDYIINSGILPEWDIIYTDIIVAAEKDMCKFMRVRRDLLQGHVALLTLRDEAFGGSAAYVLSPIGRKKLLSVLKNTNNLDAPFDLLLRKLVHTGRLRARVIFPFVTTVSEDAYVSSMQPTETSFTDMVWNLFRQLIWFERDLPPLQDKIDLIDKYLFDGASIEAIYFSKLIAAMFSASFKLK